MVPCPPFVLFTIPITKKTQTVDDLLNWRSVALKLVMRMLGNATIALTVAFVATSIVTWFNIPAAITIGCLAAAFHMIWQFARIYANSPILSRFVWGGDLYVIVDAGEYLGLEYEIGVIEHPKVRRVVKVAVPGLFDLREWDLLAWAYKPVYSHTPFQPNKESLMATLFRSIERPRRASR